MPSTDLRLIVLTGGDRPEVQVALRNLLPFLRDTEGVSLVGTFSRDQTIPLGLHADLVLVLGGDGSILRGCRQLGTQQIPIIGVNLGRLGFLTDLSPEDFLEGLSQLRSGNYEIVEHLMLECRFHQADGFVHTDLGLNEVTVTSGGSLKMLDIRMEIDGVEVTTFSCDGLIISTPVGSTAHNLSAGGPILRQDLQVVAITPICPHTLTVRPIVESADRTFSLTVSTPPPGVCVVIDGQIRRPVAAGDRIVIRRAEPTFKLVRLPGHNYYNTLHRKLGWHGQLDYQERRKP
jgi:NAD+ kinase